MPSDMHMLRILAHDGSHVVVGSDDMIQDHDTLESLLMYALQQLDQPIPASLYQNIVGDEVYDLVGP